MSDKPSPWIDSLGGKRTFKLMLDKDQLAEASKEDLKTFLQTMRIINSLRSQLKLHLKVRRMPDSLDSFKDTLELYLLMVATYYESVQSYLYRIRPGVKAEYVSDSDKDALRVLQRRLERKEGFLRIAEVVRNQIVFHFDSEVLDKFVTDGQPTDDIMVGYATGPTILETIYLEPYSCILATLAELLPADVKKADVVNWIQDTSIREVGDFCRILERTANGFFKRFGKLVERDPKSEQTLVTDLQAPERE